MASEIKRGESILIPFRNGKSIYDSQCKPRMYKTVQAFEKSFPGHYLGTGGVELVEYAEVVRCKDCQKWQRHTQVDRERGDCRRYQTTKHETGFCDRGGRRTDDTGKSD